MNLKSIAIAIFALFICIGAQGQKVYSHADSLRGNLSPERTWWDVLRYDVTVKPDFISKTIAGKNNLTYKVVSPNGTTRLQIDLKAPLVVDSVLLKGKKLSFAQDGNAWFVQMPKQAKATVHVLDIFYHGKVHEAVRPPWDGGWSFTTDSLNRPWMTVTCQGSAGASIWYPCKDHQSDEPNLGASLTMIVPDTLVGVSNGRLEYKKNNNDGTTTYKWAVVNPINNYCLIPYIGKYVNFTGTYMGEKGKLDLGYWVLDYNLNKAKAYFPKEVNQMLKSFEYWMGPYPFYEDGYQLIDAPHPGMEHQSGVAYGNFYKPGYGGRDASGTGVGMKWDFIIVHESGHEWFGNNITSKDLADMWVHEGFTNYSETMYVDYTFGKEAANDYNFGIRRGIRNDRPVIPPYNVNAQGSGDMYPKPSNMLHSIRHSMDNDERFRGIIRGLNKTFYHKTVTTQQIENYISAQAGFNYSKVFDQYLRNIKIPKLEYYFDADKKVVTYRYTNAVAGFNLPLVLKKGDQLKLRVLPTTAWKSTTLKGDEAALFNADVIVKMYYIGAEQVSGK